MAATTAVLSTYELREAIIEHLPVNDLAHCRRVCKDWQATIDQSQACSKTLFLQPAAHSDVILYKRMPQTGDWEGFLTDISALGQRNAYPIVKMHPAFSKNILERTSLTCIKFSYSFEQVLGSKANRRLRNSFLTQPPCSKLELSYPILRNGKYEESEETILQRKDGIRIKDLAAQASVILASYGVALHDNDKCEKKREIRAVVYSHVEEGHAHVRWARRTGPNPNVKKQELAEEERRWRESVKHLSREEQARAYSNFLRRRGTLKKSI